MTTYTFTEFVSKVESGEFDDMKIFGFSGMFGGARAVRPEKVCKEALIAALRQSLHETHGELNEAKVSLVEPLEVNDAMVAAIAAIQVTDGDGYDEALWDNGFEMDEDAVELVCDRLYLIEKTQGSRLSTAREEYLAALHEALQESVRGCWQESGIVIVGDENV